jgi:hypothetical protein
VIDREQFDRAVVAFYDLAQRSMPGAAPLECLSLIAAVLGTLSVIYAPDGKEIAMIEEIGNLFHNLAMAARNDKYDEGSYAPENSDAAPE